MAEIRVEPKRRNWATALTMLLGLAAGFAIVYYVLFYRNG